MAPPAASVLKTDAESGSSVRETPTVMHYSNISLLTNTKPWDDPALQRQDRSSGAGELLLDIQETSQQQAPPPSAEPVCIFIVGEVMPLAAARSARRLASSRSRPWLRLRRAEMPSRDHLVSLAIRRSIL